MKRFDWTLLLPVAALLLLVAVFNSFSGTISFRKNQAARTEMKRLMPSLQLGDSMATVGSRIRRGNFQHLKFRPIDASLWSVGTPLEFGSQNWTLFLEFDKSSKLAAIRLRTPDGLHIRPRDVTVADRVRPQWASPRPDSWGLKND